MTNRGTYESIEELQAAYPVAEAGDYALVGETTWYWNEYDQTWQLEQVATTGASEAPVVVTAGGTGQDERISLRSPSVVQPSFAGSYSTLLDLWSAYPDGGEDGMYATVGGVDYTWDPSLRLWMDVVAENPDRETEEIEGDLHVNNDLYIGGNLHCKWVVGPYDRLFQRLFQRFNDYGTTIGSHTSSLTEILAAQGALQDSVDGILTTLSAINGWGFYNSISQNGNTVTFSGRNVADVTLTIGGGSGNGNFITRSEVQQMLAQKLDASFFNTLFQAETAGRQLITPNDSQATPAFVRTMLDFYSANGVASIGTVDDSTGTGGGGGSGEGINENELSEYLTLHGYVTSDDLTGYATESFVTSQGFITSNALSGYATQQWVNEQNYLTQHQSLTDYAQKTWVQQNFSKVTLRDDGDNLYKLTITNNGTNSETGFLTGESYIWSIKWWGAQLGYETVNNVRTKVVTGNMSGVGNLSMTGKLNINGFEIEKTADGLKFNGTIYATGGIASLGTVDDSTGTGGSGGGIDEQYLSDNHYVTTSDLASYLNTNHYATESYVTSQGYITSNALSGYATQQWVKGLYWWGRQLNNGIVTGNMTGVGNIEMSGNLQTNNGFILAGKNSDGHTKSLFTFNSNNLLSIGYGTRYSSAYPTENYRTDIHGRDIRFVTGTSESGNVPLYLASNGQVGINTTDPSGYSLRVSGSTWVESTLKIGPGSGYLNLIGTSSNNLWLSSNGNELVITGAPSASTEMHINYRGSNNYTTPTKWTWHKGASNNYADFELGSILANSNVEASGYVKAGSSLRVGDGMIQWDSVNNALYPTNGRLKIGSMPIYWDNTHNTLVFDGTIAATGGVASLGQSNDSYENLFSAMSVNEGQLSITIDGVTRTESLNQLPGGLVYFGYFGANIETIDDGFLYLNGAATYVDDMGELWTSDLHLFANNPHGVIEYDFNKERAIELGLLTVRSSN